MATFTSGVLENNGSDVYDPLSGCQEDHVPVTTLHNIEPFVEYRLHSETDDDHDSGTESDDEIGDSEDQDSSMDSETERSSDSSASSGRFTGSGTICSSPSSYFLDSAISSDNDRSYDHDLHSSEEELELINSASNCAKNIGKALLGVSRSGSATAPEKRKWSQITHERGTKIGGRKSATLSHDDSSATSSEQSSGSSDEEVQGLLSRPTPVKFCTSPPLNAHKPGNSSLSPPLKLFHYEGARNNAAVIEASPRKRHRHTPRPQHIQRPCLDFEKMQQLKARAVTAWRHNADHGGELSVFCW